MGCAQSRTKPSEERAVIIAEEGLNLHLQEASRVDSTIRKFSCYDKVNESQLKRIAQVLRMHISNYENHNKIWETFHKLQTEGEYSMKDLLVIGILLSKGTPAEKSTLVFQVFDETLKGKLPMDTIKGEVLKSMCTHSVKTLGNLVNNGQSPISNELKNTKYISELSQVEKSVIDKVADKISASGKEVDERTFQQAMCTFQEGALLTTSGWRSFSHEVYVTNPPKKTWSNPFQRKPRQETKPAS